jgi:hypothetical protein
MAEVAWEEASIEIRRPAASPAPGPAAIVGGEQPVQSGRTAATLERIVKGLKRDLP